MSLKVTGVEATGAEATGAEATGTEATGVQDIGVDASRVEGSCLCGAVGFVVEGNARGFYLCHCSRCRKGTGSAHAANVFFEGAQLQWLSGGDGVTTFRVPSTRHTRSFCASCGASLPYELQGTSMVVVPAGCVDSELDLVPQAHVSCGSRAKWDHELERLPQLDGLPSGYERSSS